MNTRPDTPANPCTHRHPRSQIWLNTTLAGTAIALVAAFGAEWVARQDVVDTAPMLNASVSIRTAGRVSIDQVGDSVWAQGSGSGFLVSLENCEVWTNHHVIEGAAFIEILPRGHQGAGIEATLVSSSPRTDLAVLRMVHCDGMVAATLGDSDTLRPGDETYAVGNPLGHNPDSVSRGIVSHTERYINGAVPFVQTDAAINPGNSGGALFNRRGEIIGINTAIASRGDSRNVGVGYAIPINIARDKAARLRTGQPEWGYAGIEDRLSTLSREEAALFGAPQGAGAVVLTSTPEDGPAHGTLCARDVIIRAGGIGIDGAEQLERLIASHAPGADIELELMRNGQYTVVSLALENGWKGAAPAEADNYDGHLGMTLEMWDSGETEFQHFEAPVITHVQSLGPAHRARIMSTQRGVMVRGPYVQRYLLDVKTVTGVVFGGKYSAVRKVEKLEALAAEAHAVNEPLLLEVEYWMRENPKDLSEELKRVRTSFVRIEPATWTNTSATVAAAGGASAPAAGQATKAKAGA